MKSIEKVSKLQELRDEWQAEEDMIRLNLKDTKHLVSVWRAVIKNISLYGEEKAKELEKLIQQVAESEGGEGAMVLLDRDNSEATFFYPDGYNLILDPNDRGDL